MNLGTSLHLLKIQAKKQLRKLYFLLDGPSRNTPFDKQPKIAHKTKIFDDSIIIKFS
jgi:hypothetical protein